ncbi:YoaK family protein [Hirschia litorea]|uniref:YoaK family protein n=1 Tax=Hirschia litorea TaxID=1199156 RepID=A0ABW2IQE6_9PROT
MLLKSLRNLSGTSRSDAANANLGYCLAFIAGAINAGGFLAVGQYTSHMTGIVSSMADNIALGAYSLTLLGFGILVSFTIGAALTAILVNYSKRHKRHSTYAFPLLLEAMLILVFGVLGTLMKAHESIMITLIILLLSFIMGLQNAVITKLSKAVIRTTHITGIVTDIGIELGKLCYRNDTKNQLPKVVADLKRLKVLSLLVFSFFIGGLIGAIGFKTIHYYTTLPLALFLIILAILPVWDDFNRRQNAPTH